jgi:glutaminyl-tRNA synthetase
MAVINPLKVVITNMADDHYEEITMESMPDISSDSDVATDESVEAATLLRQVPFTREIFIDKEDFKEEYSKKFKKKFCPGKRIRMRNGYVLEATDFIKDDAARLFK